MLDELREKVRKAFTICSSKGAKKCHDCPYDSIEWCMDTAIHDAMLVLEYDAKILMKEKTNNVDSEEKRRD